jgi:hypothetical protein
MGMSYQVEEIVVPALAATVRTIIQQDAVGNPLAAIM